MGVRPPRSTTVSSVSSSVMDGDRLGKWIFRRSFWWPLSARSPSAVWMFENGVCAGIYRQLRSVLPHHCGRPSRFLAAVTQLSGGNFGLLISLFLLEFLWSSFYLTASNQLWNYCILFKWNDFPEKGQIIPHVNTLPLLHFQFCLDFLST